MAKPQAIVFKIAQHWAGFTWLDIWENIFYYFSMLCSFCCTFYTGSGLCPKLFGSRPLRGGVLWHFVSSLNSPYNCRLNILFVKTRDSILE